MLKIDRMEVDDVGGNAVRLANAVVEQIPDLKPPVPVREIAAALDIYEIREEALDGLEGCLITPDHKGEGAILVNKRRHETRKRFTIGHELGHFLNPFHRATGEEGFRCGSADLRAERFRKGDRRLQMEVEANQFAAALLLPPKLFSQQMKSMRGVDLAHIIELASLFEVSREALARRYIEAAGEPVAVVFSKDGVIRYAKPSEDFPRLSCGRGDRLPPRSLSSLSDAAVGVPSEWDEVDGGQWLAASNGRLLCEQTLAQAKGYRMSLLALEDGAQEGDEDEWSPPTFHRR